MKPPRAEADEAELEAKCNAWRKLRQRFCTTKVDAIIDSEERNVPESVRGRKLLNALKVRFRLRKKSHGLRRGPTKPRAVKHRANNGGGTLRFSRLRLPFVCPCFLPPRRRQHALVTQSSFSRPAVS